MCLCRPIRARPRGPWSATQLGCDFRMSSSTAPLLPLLVASSDLPGSIRPVMNLLSAMPETTADWCPLTDRRPLTYLVRHAAVLGGYLRERPGWNHDSVIFPPSRLPTDFRGIEGFPEPGNKDLDGLDSLPLWQALLRENVANYCAAVRSGPEQRLCAEPTGWWTSTALSMAGIEHRTLLIVRDPRSELAEQWSSSGRLGALPGPITHVDTPLTYAEREANWVYRQQLDALAKLGPNPNQVLVRYEDVLAEPAKVWLRLRAWLGLAETALPTLEPTGHEWPALRWQTILPDSVSALCRRRMQREMEAHGYAC